MKIKVYIDLEEKKVYTEKMKAEKINNFVNDLAREDYEDIFSDLECGDIYRSLSEWFSDKTGFSSEVLYNWDKKDKINIIETFKEETKKEIDERWELIEDEIEI